jgi:hypothetical protein
MTKFDFQTYYKFGNPIHIQSISEPFLEWFIGFFEGDGYITQWFDKGKLRIAIGIDQKDPALIYKIRKELGFGRVRKYNRNGEFYWRWIVESREGIERISHLFNGNLVLVHRQEQFKYMLDSFLRHYPTPSLSYREVLIQPTLDDGWLSGFSEAECGFDGNFTNNFKRGQYSNGFQRYAIKLKFYITQKSIDKQILNHIGTLFNLNKIRIYPVQTPEQTGSFLYYRLEINTSAGHDSVIQYLTKFPLKGQKRFALIRFILLRRRQITRGSRFESDRMARRTARLINFFVEKRKKKDVKIGEDLIDSNMDF